jgi:hypothetical protein
MTVHDVTQDRSTALPGQRASVTDSKPRGAAVHLSPRERASRGLAARTTVPPGEHAELMLPADRPHPVAVMEEQAVSRVPELVPVRHGRMMVSPFTFYRGAAKIMAADLKTHRRPVLTCNCVVTLICRISGCSPPRNDGCCSI